MNEKKPIETPEDLIEALDALFNQILMNEPDEARDVLREAGYNPDQLGKELAEFAQQASTKSPLNWRNRQNKLDEAKSQIYATGESPKRSRNEKEVYIEHLFTELGQQAALAHRNFKELPEEDLDSLIRQTEYLKAQQKRRKDTQAGKE